VNPDFWIGGRPPSKINFSEPKAFGGSMSARREGRGLAQPRLAGASVARLTLVEDPNLSVSELLGSRPPSAAPQVSVIGAGCTWTPRIGLIVLSNDWTLPNSCARTSAGTAVQASIFAARAVLLLPPRKVFLSSRGSVGHLRFCDQSGRCASNPASAPVSHRHGLAPLFGFRSRVQPFDHLL
jgi:hypothetical protein